MYVKEHTTTKHIIQTYKPTIGLSLLTKKNFTLFFTLLYSIKSKEQ